MKKSTLPYENQRIHGSALSTTLSQLPERFHYGPHTELMSRYLSRRWKATSYGWWKRAEHIEYNQEHVSEQQLENLGRFPWTPVDRYRWIEHPTDGLRFVGKVHEIRMTGDGNLPYIDHDLVNHYGWFLDEEFQDETAWGEVYQLPCTGMNPGWRYVPAVNNSFGNDGALIDFHSVTNDIREAVRDADSMAERYAEDEREYQRKSRATDRIEEIQDEIKAEYDAFRVLAKEIRANCDKLTGLTAIQTLIRDHWKGVRAAIEELREEKTKLEGEI